MKFRILGKVWQLLFARTKDLPHDRWGECDPPHKRGRCVKVHEDLRGQKLLEIILHESLHAAAFELLDEEFVSRVTADQAKLLWQPELLQRILEDEALQACLVTLNERKKDGPAPQTNRRKAGARRAGEPAPRVDHGQVQPDATGDSVRATPPG